MGVDDLTETGTLIRKVFELLLKSPDGLTVRELLDKYSEVLFRDGGEGRHQCERALRGGCIAPVNAGWLVCPDGMLLSISESGKSAYARYQDPAKFMREAGKLSTKGWLSLRFPRSYYLAGLIRDQLHAEIRAARGIGLKHLVGRFLRAPTAWRRELPLQEPRRVTIEGLDDTTVRSYLDAAGVEYSEGGHTVYLPIQSFRSGVFQDLADDYPPDAGLKIVNDPGGVRDSRYVNRTNKGDSQIHLGLVHTHSHLTLVANLLYAKRVGPRLYDLVELQCGDQLLTAYVIEHVGGPVPSMSECQRGIEQLRNLEHQGLMKSILPDGFDDEEFECPSCSGNALTNQNARFSYVDFQNFILLKYESYLRNVAVEATKVSHFGDTSVLRGGRYLYQSIPGVNLPSKRSIGDRMRVLNALLASTNLSLRDRLVLDVGCNIGMMMGQYLKLGARWCHGWDRDHVTQQTEKLLLALGCTRFSTTGGDITSAQGMESDLPAFLTPRLDGCVISYLAVRGHLGWLDALARIPWNFLIYEGHEGETREDFERYVAQFRATTEFTIGGVIQYADGDSDERTLAILVRS